MPYPAAANANRTMLMKISAVMCILEFYKCLLIYLLWEIYDNDMLLNLTSLFIIDRMFFVRVIFPIVL